MLIFHFNPLPCGIHVDNIFVMKFRLNLFNVAATLLVSLSTSFYRRKKAFFLRFERKWTSAYSPRSYTVSCKRALILTISSSETEDGSRFGATVGYTQIIFPQLKFSVLEKPTAVSAAVEIQKFSKTIFTAVSDILFLKCFPYS